MDKMSNATKCLMDKMSNATKCLTTKCIILQYIILSYNGVLKNTIKQPNLT